MMIGQRSKALTPMNVLNNIDHKDLKVDVSVKKAFGDYVNRARVFSSEFSDLHKEFPILLYKNPETNAIDAHAILGFEKDENLFIQNEAWTSKYMPAVFACGPFSIGSGANDSGEEDLGIMVDENHPRCSSETGEAVFLEFGGESPYLESVKKALGVVDYGVKLDALFFDLALEFDLIEEIAITINLSEEKQVSFKNYFTVNQEKLLNLDGDALEKINKSGTLGLFYYLISSLGNFNHMIELKNSASVR